MATVKNISRQPVTVILDHPAFANTRSGWRRTSMAFASTSAEGGLTTQEVRRALPGSLTILPGQSVSDLHPAIIKCKQVPQLIQDKVLSVELTERSGA